MDERVETAGHQLARRLTAALVITAIVVLGGGLALAADGPVGRAPASVGSAVLPGLFVPVAPVRILDTRPLPASAPNGPVPADATPLGPGAQRDVRVALPDSGPAPQGPTTTMPSWLVASDATAVLLNVTVDKDATLPSFLTAWATGAARPFTSVINAEPGRVVANSVSVAVGADGSISFFNQQGTVNLVVDLVGYLAPPRPATQGATYLASPVPLAAGANGTFAAPFFVGSLEDGEQLPPERAMYHVHAVVQATAQAGLPAGGTLQCWTGLKDDVRVTVPVEPYAADRPADTLALDVVWFHEGRLSVPVFCRVASAAAAADPGAVVTLVAITVEPVGSTSQVSIVNPRSP